MAGAQRTNLAACLVATPLGLRWAFGRAPGARAGDAQGGDASAATEHRG
jgi:hypothetical protein